MFSDLAYFCDSCGGDMKTVPHTGFICGCGGEFRPNVMPSIHGVEFTNFVKEYEAHPEKHPTADDNIRYCEQKLQKSRFDEKLTVRKPRKRWL